MLIPDERVVGAIIESSIRNNERFGVTGMLLYADGNIVQVLEGEHLDVDSIFDKIRIDSRHTNIFVLYEQKVSKRDFPLWSMGCICLHDADIERFQNSRQLFTISELEIEHRSTPCEALRVLKSFAQNAQRNSTHWH